MKNNSNKQLIHVLAPEDSLLRLAYKNEEVINETANISADNEKHTIKAKTPNKLFVKEPRPLFDDYKFKIKDHDPL